MTTATNLRLQELIALCIKFKEPLPIDELRKSLGGDDARSILEAHGADQNLLHVVCYSWHVTLEVVKWLVDLYPDAIRQDGGGLGLPLHKACMNTEICLDIVQFLIDKYPEGLSMFWNGEETPLACLVGNCTIAPPRMDLIKHIIDRAPETVRILIDDERSGGRTITVFQLACRGRYVSLELLQILVSQWPESVFMRGAGRLPLHELLSNRHSGRCRDDPLRVALVRFVVDAHPEGVREMPQETNHTGSLPLHSACARGDSLETIKLIGDTYPEAYQMISGGRIASLPLHAYCLKSDRNLDLEVLQLLCEKCPEGPRTRNRFGFLPLTFAFSNGSMDVIRYLVDQYPESARDTDCFQAALCRGNDEVFEYFVTLFPEGISAISRFGTILHAAANGLQASQHRLRRILKLHPESIKLANQDGNLPLHMACSRWCGSETGYAYVRFLLAQYPDAANVKNNEGRPPLHLIYNPRNGIAPQLFATDRVVSVTKILLGAHSAAVRVVDDEGRLPLHHVCKDGYSIEVVKMLMEKYPSSIRVSSRNHGLPIHVASSDPLTDFPLLEYLFGLAADTLDVYIDGLGLPLHCAARTGSSQVFLFLLAMRYKEPRQSEFLFHSMLRDQDLADKAVIANRILDNYRARFVKQDTRGVSPFHLAVTTDVGNSFLRKLYESDPTMVSLKDKSNSLPLHYALRHGDPSNIIEGILLNHFPEAVRVEDANGFLPLHVACRHSAPLETIQRLVELYPDAVVAADQQGELPLHKACRTGNLAAVEYLVGQNDASVRRANAEGFLPALLLCQKSGKKEHLMDDTTEISTIWLLLRKHPEAILNF